MRFFIYRVPVTAFSLNIHLVYFILYNQINARALIGHTTISYSLNSWKNRASSEFVTNSSRVLQTTRVVYQATICLLKRDKTTRS